MKKSRFFIIFIVFLIVFSTGYYLYNKTSGVKKIEKKYREVEVVREDLDITITATGVVNASTQIDIKSEIGGKVIELPFEEGAKISKGDVLAVIDDKQQREKYVQSDADYRNNFAQLEKAMTSMELEGSLNSITIKTRQEELERAEIEYEQALIKLEEQKIIGEKQINQAKASLETSQKQLDKALAGSREQEKSDKLEQLKQAEITMENARKEYERQAELYKKDYVAQRNVDDAEKVYLIAESEYEAIKDQYDMLLEGTRIEEIDVLKAQVEEARKTLELRVSETEQEIEDQKRNLEILKKTVNTAGLALNEALENELQVKIRGDEVSSMQASLDKADATRKQTMDELSKTKILSPIDGVIINRPIEIGDVVASQTMSSSAGTILMTIADLAEIYAEADIDESDIGKITPDLPVTIRASAYEDLEIPGVIKFIATQAVQVEQIPTFKLKIKILLDKIKEKDLPKNKSRYELLFPGMSVDADIHVEKKEQVLQIPIEAVWKKDGKNYVTLLKGPDSFEEIEVELGIKNNITVEVIKGLNEGDKIIIEDIIEEETGTGGPPRGRGERW